MASGPKSAKLTSSLLRSGAARLRGGRPKSARKGKGSVSIAPPPVPAHKRLVLEEEEWLKTRGGKFDYSENAPPPHTESLRPGVEAPAAAGDGEPASWSKYAGGGTSDPSAKAFLDFKSDETYSWSKYDRPAARDPAERAAMAPVSRLDALPEIAQKRPLQLTTLVIPPTIESLYAASFDEHGASDALPKLELSAAPDAESEIEIATPAPPALLALAHAEVEAASAPIEPFFDPLAALAEPVAPPPAAPAPPEPQPSVNTEADAASLGSTLAVPSALPISNPDRVFAALALKPRLTAWATLSKLSSSLDTGGDPIADAPVLAAPQPLLLAHLEAETAATVLASPFDPLAALAEPVAAEPAPLKPQPTAEAEAPPEAVTLTAPSDLPHSRTDQVFSALAVAPGFGNWTELSRTHALFEPDDTSAGAPKLAAPSALALSHPELAAAAPDGSAFDPLAGLAEPIEAEPTTAAPQTSAPAEVEAAPEVQTPTAFDAPPLDDEPRVAEMFAEVESAAQFSAWPGLPELQPILDIDAEFPAEPATLAAPEPLALGHAEIEGVFGAEPTADPLLAALEQPAGSEAENPEPSSTTAPKAETGAETPALAPAEAELLIEASAQPGEAVVELAPAPTTAPVMAAQPGEVETAAFEPATDPLPVASDQPVDLGIETPATSSPVLAAQEAEVETSAPTPADMQLLLEAFRPPSEANIEPAPALAPAVVAQPEAIEAEPSSLAPEELPAADAPEQPVAETVEAVAADTVEAAEAAIEPAPIALAAEPEVEPAAGTGAEAAAASIIEEAAIDPAPSAAEPLVAEPEQRGPISKPTDEAVTTTAAESPSESVPLAAQPSEPVAEPEPEFSVDAEVDPNAERRAAVAALTDQLSSVIGNVLETKNYPKVTELRQRGHPEPRAAKERAGTRTARPATPTGLEPQTGSGIVVNLPRKQPAERRRSWVRTAMAAASVMMIIASGLVAFGLSNSPRASAPPVQPVAATTPQPAVPEHAPLASAVTPEVQEPVPAPEPIAPAPPQTKPANQKLHHASGTRTK
ncbi:MAG TPA: hypothetical protein VLX09_09130 [Stellaceae bacterium]|nr:hypothetical protein [Stellaceae bacterium]